MNIKEFKKICRIKNQIELKKLLKEILEKYYTTIVDEDGFLYVPSSNVDVMLTAHIDTVHKEECKKIMTIKREGKKALWSPQGIGGDDRCGVFMIMEILRTTDFRPSIVFCEDEEIGGVGSDKFANWLSKRDEALNIKYIIELDRRNGRDCVFYDCGNKEFKKYIEDVTGYAEAGGSFSDIGNISPVLDVASVNLSCGYYLEHTLNHYVVIKEMENTFEVTKKLLADADNVEKFDYQEEKYLGYWGSGYFGYSNNIYYNYREPEEDLTVVCAIVNGMEVMGEYSGSWYECVGQFLTDNPDVTYNQVTFVGSKYEYTGEVY